MNILQYCVKILLATLKVNKLYFFFFLTQLMEENLIPEFILVKKERINLGTHSGADSTGLSCRGRIADRSYQYDSSQRWIFLSCFYILYHQRGHSGTVCLLVE